MVGGDNVLHVSPNETLRKMVEYGHMRTIIWADRGVMVKFETGLNQEIKR